ncbi:3-hydroxyisobutyryl-CoA hydrolase [Sarracenia purpurea var. burkii]
MYNFKLACLMRRYLGISRFVSGYRSLSSSNGALRDDLLDNLVLVEGKTWSRTAILNRPTVLNALNTSMAARLQKLYKCWEDNPSIGFVVLKGSGRALCAGGDIVYLYHLINEELSLSWGRILWISSLKTMCAPCFCPDLVCGCPTPGNSTHDLFDQLFFKNISIPSE